MKVLLKHLTLRNFKKLRDLHIDFSHETNITGFNALGKTSIFDAYTWLLFGKDSHDAKDFNIKTLDENNKPIHRLEHEVIGVLEMDGNEVELRRCLKEKWVTTRGQAIPEFKGHETTFYVNGVPKGLAEYNAAVAEIVKEELFKLVTSPTYFNQQLKWNDRRNILTAMAGDISDASIAEGNEKFTALLSELSKYKDISEYKAVLAARKKKLKADLEHIPARIDEANRSMPPVPNYAQVEKDMEAYGAALKDVEQLMEDKQQQFQKEYEAIQAKHNEKAALQNKLRELQSANSLLPRQQKIELDGKIGDARRKVSNAENEVSNITTSISGYNNRINKIEADIEALREKYRQIDGSALVIDEHKFECPTCKRMLEAGDIEKQKETLTSNFNNDKIKKLERINDEGKSLKTTKEDLQGKVTKLESDKAFNEHKREEYLKEVETLLAQKQALEETPVTVSPEEIELQKQIEAFVIPAAPSIDNSALKQRKADIMAELSTLNNKLAVKGQIEKTNERIAELETLEKDLAQQVADIENTEFAIAEFSKCKIEAIEKRINGKFKYVRWKMFEQQINGGETECCECLVNGVPYSDVNTAGKINAGIDIINALSEHYGIVAPVWIDNRESVIELLPCQNQLINLIATNDRELRFDNGVTTPIRKAMVTA